MVPRMSEFLAALQAFPTMLFSGLLALMLLYWLTVIVGALDVDLFGHHGGHVDGDMAPGGHDGHGFAEFISLGKVPITITASAFALVGWSLGMLAEIHLRPLIGVVLPGPLYPLIMLVALVAIAGFAAAWMVRPLRRIFTMHTEHGEASLVGKMVRITSLKADHRFGTALCDNAGPGIIMQVVLRQGVELKRDDMAVVVEYDEAKGLYLVAPFAHLKADEALARNHPGLLPPPEPSSPVVVETPASTPVTPVSLERRNERPQ
jgi:hypothetical protein